MAQLLAVFDGEKVSAFAAFETETAAALNALLPDLLDHTFKGEL